LSVLCETQRPITIIQWNIAGICSTGGTFFFTLVTHQRTPYFRDESNVALLGDAIRYVQRHHPFELVAFVFLPDHLHMIWQLPEEDDDYPTRVRLMKSFVSRKMAVRPMVINRSRIAKGEQEVWQRRYWEHSCKDQDDLNAYVDYIHYNPVKHGYITAPCLWKHSSFGKYVEDGVYEMDWGADGEESFGFVLEGE